MQFARVAHATGFVYCYSIMDANRRSDYAIPPVSASVAQPARGPSKAQRLALERTMASELNAFFPFDPYKLPRSGRYIQGVYREWSSVAIDDEDEDDEDEDDDEGEDALDEDQQGDDADLEPQGILVNGRSMRQQEDSTEGLGGSFGGMSISPAQPHMPPQTHPLAV